MSLDKTIERCENEQRKSTSATYVSADSREPSNPVATTVYWDGLLFFFLVGCGFSIFPIVNSVHYHRDNKDYSLWYVVGRAVVADEPLYRDVRVYRYVQGSEPEYMYPPTAAVLLYAPLSKLGPVFFSAVLCLMNALAWPFAVWASTVLVAGKWVGRPCFATIAPGLAVAAYVWDVQLLGQLNLLLLALTLGAFVALRGRQSILAGGLFGLAVALKAFPLSAIAYFVVRRRWMAVVATIASIIGFVWFLPGIARGFERNTSELMQWASLMVGDQSGRTMAGRSSIGFTRRNQSLVSLSHRLLRHVNSGDHPKKPRYVNFADVSPGTAQLIGYGSCVLLGLILLVACRFRFGQSCECEGLEVAMVCTLVPLCSPLAWTYFFCWLLPAWTAIGFWIQNPSLTAKTRRVVKSGTVIAGLLIISAVTEQFDPTLQALGVTALGSVMLFLTLAYIRFNLGSRLDTQLGSAKAILAST